jgi:S-DNA-T family DNA segregation ATPase FtsK/SpoIIIE
MLKRMSDEMNSRYKILENSGLKHIKEYIEQGGKMSYICFIIDEFNQLIQSSEKSVSQATEKYVEMISQLARAVGIHLIVATQNPIREVIKSNIKANLTSQI